MSETKTEIPADVVVIIVKDSPGSHGVSVQMPVEFVGTEIGDAIWAKANDVALQVARENATNLREQTIYGKP